MTYVKQTQTVESGPDITGRHRGMGSSGIGGQCKEVEPGVTDLGICYSFNAKSSMKMLKHSSFTDAFQEAYEN